MRTITSEAKLIQWLFVQLKRSTPQVAVTTQFLGALASTCEALAFDADAARPLKLAEPAWSQDELADCGSKLVEFARALTDAGALDPSAVWSRSGVIRLMMKSLDLRGLTVRKDREKPTESWVRSGSGFPYAHKLRVRVRLVRKHGPKVPLGGRLDRRTIQLSEARSELLSATQAQARMRERVCQLQTRIEHSETQHEQALRRLAQAERLVRERDDWILELRERVVRAETELRATAQRLRSGPIGGDPLYTRVGLHEKCPDFLLLSARRAYLAQLHPDRYPEQIKAAATARFQEAENVFSQLYKQRGLR